MFDIAWSEFLVVAVVALVVVGPRDLPALLRTVGKTVATLRRMAGEFQGQFNEAMREAELDDLKRDITGIKDSASKMVGASPFQIARDELKNALDAKPKAAAPSALAGETPSAEAAAVAPSALAPEIEPTPEAPAPTEAEFVAPPSDAKKAAMAKGGAAKRVAQPAAPATPAEPAAEPSEGRDASGAPGAAA